MNSNLSISKLLKKYALPFWKQLTALIVLSLITSFFTTIQPIIISGLLEIIVGDISSQKPSTELESNNLFSFFDLNDVGNRVKNIALFYGDFEDEFVLLKTSSLLLIVFIFAAFFASIFGYLANSCSSLLKALATQLLRKELSSHFLSLNISFFHKQKIGELISRFTTDATNTAIGIGPLLHGFLHHGILILVYGTYLFSTDPLLTFGVLIIISFQYLITLFLKRPIQLFERKNLDQSANLITNLQEALTSIRVIKSFGAEKQEKAKINQSIANAKNADFKNSLVKNIEPKSREFLDALSIAAIFLMGLHQLTSNKITLQGFLLFVLVGRLIITPINKFSVCFVWMHSLIASYGRIDELLSISSEIKDGNKQIRSFSDNIKFNNVSFSYGSNSVLSNISFTLKKGETIALVGESGAGKSTITDLLLRLYDPDDGEILIDNLNLKKFHTSKYRELFGVVSQESLLFNDTIENNIRFGRDNISQKQVETAAKEAFAYDFIQRLPDGFQTVVGDRGIKLSGGERQRISIARAICAKPQVLLFDEATSSLDSKSESKVQNAMLSIWNNSTGIIIAHRFSTILNVNKIIVISNGKIEAEGSHKELLVRSETYKKLYNMQNINNK